MENFKQVQELKYKFQDIIRRIIAKVINHKFIFEMNPIVEMIILDRIASFQFIVWSNDYSNYYQFHTLYKGYDVTFNGENGELISINIRGKDKSDFLTLCAYTKNWLFENKDYVLNRIKMLQQ